MEQKKNRTNLILGIIIAVLGVMLAVLTVFCVYLVRTKKAEKAGNETEETADEDGRSKGSRKGSRADEDTSDSGIEGLELTSLRDPMKIDFSAAVYDGKPQNAPYRAEPDLSNVVNGDMFYLQDHTMDKLVQNNFVVTEGGYSEFFDVYEGNRYSQKASFITTDAMMHTYHLYFAKLQKTTEKAYLADEISKLGKRMLTNSIEQYKALKGSEWEDAAKINVEFFAVASVLMDGEAEMPGFASKIVKEETGYIMDSKGINRSPMLQDDEDYSQYKPRGYYEGDKQLEKYFRTMMWYGRRNFAQNDELSNRCALLMTLAMDDEALSSWERVYKVTAFFAGTSDDAGYYEYRPAIDAAYGEGVTVSDLPGDDASWEKFRDITSKLDPPKINSVIFDDDDGATEKREEAKGYRFMGQRFTLDGQIFTELCYSHVEEDPQGRKRTIPDALDVPAAMGSDAALSILEENGETEYEGYKENMLSLREMISNAPEETWSASLYGGWLHTISPLLEKKPEGYPAFMTTDEWMKKSVETYLGSWTELKHDTVLYSKQFMAEMGGGDEEEVDDRGYVEPEPVLYMRLAALCDDTAAGLEDLGVISNDDKALMSDMSDLCDRLSDISVKELAGETLSDDEYELIRSFGGTLEHFWRESLTDTPDGHTPDSREFPAALVVDVATDPNGAVLEEAIGGISAIYVIFPLEGKLHMAKGGVFTYYQFTVPISERMTDKDWRRKLGMELSDDMEYIEPEKIDQPAWTGSYRTVYKYD